MRILLILALLSSLLFSADVTVDSNTTYQTFIGWDAKDETGIFPVEFYQSKMETHHPLYIDTLLTLLVNQAGVNMMQVTIWAGMENTTDYWQAFFANQDASSLSDFTSNVYVPVNDNGDPKSINASGFQWSKLDSVFNKTVIPLRNKLLREKGDTLYIYLNYVDQNEGTAFDHSADSSEHAEFIEAAILHIYNTYGFLPDGINVINEPDDFTDWNNGSQVGEHVKAVIDRIQSHGWDIDVMAPATLSQGAADSYFDNIWSTLAGDDTSYFKFLSYHKYSGRSDETLNDIEQRVLAHVSILGSHMSEWWHAANDYTVLHDDLKNGANAAWQQGIAGSITIGSAGPYYEIDTTASPPQVITHDKTKYNMLYYNQIKRNAVRVEATSTDGNIDPVAFQNENGMFTIVFKASASSTFTVGGLPTGNYAKRYTTSTSVWNKNDGGVSITSGDDITITMPAAGVYLLYQLQPIDTVYFYSNTLVNAAPGSDNWPVTWADDGNQYTSFGDGGGFGGDNNDGRVSLGFSRITGSYDNQSYTNMWGGKNPVAPATFNGKTHGIVSIMGRNGNIYMGRDGDGNNNDSWHFIQIYKSSNYCQSWTNTGVEFDGSDFTGTGIRLSHFLNFNQDYAGALDDYLYMYGIEVQDDNWDVQNPGLLHLMRVHLDSIETESQWHVFSGTPTSPAWSRNLDDRQPVWTDSTNGIMRNSVTWVEKLSRYIFICQQADRNNVTNARVGIYEAPNPWGPFTQIMYANPFSQMGGLKVAGNKTTFFDISTKWTAEAGGDTVVWIYTGPGDDEYGSIKSSFATIQQVQTNPPVAEFSGTPRSGDVPLNVTFTDLSTNTPTSWLWEYSYNGGAYQNFTSSTSQNPSQTFTPYGNYSIRLTATNADGSDSEVKTNYIIVDDTTTIPAADKLRISKVRKHPFISPPVPPADPADSVLSQTVLGSASLGSKDSISYDADGFDDTATNHRLRWWYIGSGSVTTLLTSSDTSQFKSRLFRVDVEKDTQVVVGCQSFKGADWSGYHLDTVGVDSTGGVFTPEWRFKTEIVFTRPYAVTPLREVDVNQGNGTRQRAQILRGTHNISLESKVQNANSTPQDFAVPDSLKYRFFINKPNASGVNVKTAISSVLTGLDTVNWNTTSQPEGTYALTVELYGSEIGINTDISRFRTKPLFIIIDNDGLPETGTQWLPTSGMDGKRSQDHNAVGVSWVNYTGWSLPTVITYPEDVFATPPADSLARDSLATTNTWFTETLWGALNDRYANEATICVTSEGHRIITGTRFHSGNKGGFARDVFYTDGPRNQGGMIKEAEFVASARGRGFLAATWTDRVVYLGDTIKTIVGYKPSATQHPPVLKDGPAMSRTLVGTFTNNETFDLGMSPYMVFDPADSNKLYIADEGNHRIAVIELNGGDSLYSHFSAGYPKVTTYAGQYGTAGATNGDTSVASMNAPYCITMIDTFLYWTEPAQNKIRRVNVNDDQVETMDFSGYTGTYPTPVTTIRHDHKGNLLVRTAANNSPVCRINLNTSTIDTIGTFTKDRWDVDVNGVIGNKGDIIWCGDGGDHNTGRLEYNTGSSYRMMGDEGYPEYYYKNQGHENQGVYALSIAIDDAESRFITMGQYKERPWMHRALLATDLVNIDQNVMQRGNFIWDWGTIYDWHDWSGQRASFATTHGYNGHHWLGSGIEGMDELALHHDTTLAKSIVDSGLGTHEARPELTGEDLTALIYYIKQLSVHGKDSLYSVSSIRNNVSLAGYYPNTGDQTAPTISNINVTILGGDSIQIDWTTNEAAMGIVKYGTAEATISHVWNALSVYGLVSQMPTSYGTSQTAYLINAQSNTKARIVAKDIAGNVTISSEFLLE